MGRRCEDDDGHTIADMSGVTRPKLFGRLPERRVEGTGETPGPENKGPSGGPSALDQPMTRAERRMYMWGAMKAGLLIALAYIAGIGAFILLLLFIGDVL